MNTATVKNLLIHGDCLMALPKLPKAGVKPVCIDPPFFSNSNYEKIWLYKGQTAFFKDRRAGDTEHYRASKDTMTPDGRASVCQV